MEGGAALSNGKHGKTIARLHPEEATEGKGRKPSASGLNKTLH